MMNSFRLKQKLKKAFALQKKSFKNVSKKKIKVRDLSTVTVSVKLNKL